MDGGPIAISSALKTAREAAAAAFQAQLTDALRLGADAFWRADEHGIIRHVLALGEDRSRALVNLLESKPLLSLLGTVPPSANSFRDIRADVRPIGGDAVIMSLSGRKTEDGRWHGIARIAQQGTPALSDRQTRSVLDQLRESRDRELLLRQETETLLDGLRILTGGLPGSDIFAALLDRLAPALDVQAAIILQQSWAGAISVAAATTPSLKSLDVQALGERLLALEEIAAPAPLGTLPAPWTSGLSIKLRSGSTPTLLLCLHEQPNFFAARHLGLGMRLSLLASQAFQSEEERQRVVEASKLAAIGEMAAGVVHEINQPLTAMLLGLTTLKSGLEAGHYDPAKAVEKLARLEGQVHRIAKIIASMRTLARRSDGVAEPFVLLEAVRDALTIIEHKLKQREIALTLGMPETLKAYGHAGECTQVVLNLLSNAHDAIVARAAKTDDRAHAITIQATPVDADWLDLEVRDTGGGFPPAGMEKALLPFFTTKPAGQGTGLGLALCRRIVETMGGSLTLANWEKGALVRLRLRRCPS